MSIRAFLYSGGPPRPSSRHNDLLLFSLLIRSQTKMRWPSARPLIKPNTRHQLLITSKQQQESSPGQRLYECEDEGTKRRDRKWRQVSRLSIRGPCAARWHIAATAFPPPHRHRSKGKDCEKRGENRPSPKHFTLTINPFGTLVFWTGGYATATTHTTADGVSQLITLS